MEETRALFDNYCVKELLNNFIRTLLTVKSSTVFFIAFVPFTLVVLWDPLSHPFDCFPHHVGRRCLWLRTSVLVSHCPAGLTNAYGVVCLQQLNR